MYDVASVYVELSHLISCGCFSRVNRTTTVDNLLTDSIYPLLNKDAPTIFCFRNAGTHFDLVIAYAFSRLGYFQKTPSTQLRYYYCQHRCFLKTTSFLSYTPFPFPIRWFSDYIRLTSGDSTKFLGHGISRSPVGCSA